MPSAGRPGQGNKCAGVREVVNSLNGRAMSGGSYCLFLLLLASVPCPGDGCQGRKVLTDPSGEISDGSKNYTNFSRCEWLIKASSPSKVIQLEFQFLETECSYDFLFVFDGHSYNNPMLASLSGHNIPEPIIATSGQMLIYLFSDRNYNQLGFVAHYRVLDCPFNCSGNGLCDNNVCICDQNFTGNACQIEMCPGDCGEHGHCVGDGVGVERWCQCDEGYSGFICNISLHDASGSKHWYTLAPSGTGFQARSSHAGVFLDQSDCLFVFGGFTLNVILDDLVVYCMNESRWNTVPVSDPWPEGRSEHAIVGYENGFYMYGGILSSGNYSDELWYFSAENRSWQLAATNSSLYPQMVSGHSLTLVDDQLYLFGGKTQDGRFWSDIYKISAADPGNWTKVSVFGGKTSSIRLVGHTAVFHQESRSLLIYAGYTHTDDQSRFGTHTARLHAFHVDKRVWSRVHFDLSDPDSVPTQRSFHSALIMGNYMVVYGGNTHIHHQKELCYDYEMYLFHLGCFTWVRVDTLMGRYRDSRSERMPGRVSHIAAAAYGNILLIAGGYSGYVRGDFLAFKFPEVLAPPASHLGEDLDYCVNYTRDKCGFNPDCFYCDNITATNKVGCMHRTLSKLCSETLNYYYPKAECPGICSTLTSCQDCLTQGQGVTLTQTSPRRRMYIQPCNWCVKEAECQARNSPKGTCDDARKTESELIGWWGGKSASLSKLDQCQTEDIPAGLQSVKYRAIQNRSHPDEVRIIRKTEEMEQFRHIFRQGYSDRVHWLGYIHPLNATSKLIFNQTCVYSLQLVTENITVKVFLSKDDQPENKIIGSPSSIDLRTGNQYRTEFDSRKDGSPIFPNVTRGHRYFIMVSGSHQYPTHNRDMALGYSIYRMELQWSGISPNNTNNLQFFRPFSYEFLEPFSGGGVCEQWSNCLACMTDTDCGWCEAESRCISRKSTGDSLCIGLEKKMILVTTPETCPLCPDHVHCETCVEDPLCEWVKENASCVRRGRVDTSKVIHSTGECPPRCHGHSTCSKCLLVLGCAWCENLHSCLPFSDYVSRHRYGQCTEWIDGEAASENPYSCRDCNAKGKCEACLETFSCGWCGNAVNPTYGVCAEGDFSGPYGQTNCSVIVNSRFDIPVTENAGWSYETCPDVNECLLDLDKCHSNATCINTPTSYNCTCNRGFHGDGRDVCERTCYHMCVYGLCMEDDDGEFYCDCDLGWTGDNCSVNCQCNGHSMCSEGVGICDYCSNGTTGQYCERCLPGFFGDPTKSDGCYPCQCNGHGSVKLGLCHNETGQCFCEDNTVGFKCDKCQEGFYGDPHDGGRCYQNCDHGVILTDVTGSGALGSHRGPGVSTWLAYCLWILTVSPELSWPLHNPSSITLNIEDLAVECERDHFYVYDGVPSFVDETGNGVLLGAFCGFFQREYHPIQIKSGILTVYFHADKSGNFSSTRGFNASYTVNKCSDCSEHDNKKCEAGVCVCQPGYQSPDCSVRVCPQDCTYQQESDSCQCEAEIGGATYNVANYPWDFNENPAPVRLGGAGPVSRYGHTFIRCDDTVGYLFGGRSLEHGLLNDIWEYNFIMNTWMEIKPFTDAAPSPRYFHAATCVPILKTLYVFGGLVMAPPGSRLQYQASKEMWRFAIGAKKWTDCNEPVWVMGLAGHSMTLVESTKLVIIGGFSTEKYFSDTVYEFDANRLLNAWQAHKRENITGPKPTGLYGHSGVYHEASKSIYIYGGHVYKAEKLRISSHLFVYDVPTKAWNVLQPEPRSKLDGRYFHTAVGFDDYMVVLGGFTHYRNLSTDVLVYRYTCNFWHSFSITHTEAGQLLSSVAGAASVAFNSSMYVIGGYNNMLHNTMLKLSLPQDICSLTSDINRCLFQPGCSACVQQTETGENVTRCYSTGQKPPANCISSQNLTGQRCDLKWHIERDCSLINSCSECVAVYPQFKSAENSCVWCVDCQTEKCKPRSSMYDRLGSKNKTERNINTHPSDCDCFRCASSDCGCFNCPASTCDRCTEMNCVWSRHFERSAGGKIHVSFYPIYDWSCFGSHLKNNLKGYKSFTVPPGVCPVPCYVQKTCSDCLGSEGAEGGSQECYWSVTLQECLAPAYLSLHCSGGECGTVLQGEPDKCPLPCSVHTQCADCRQAAGCGWCAFGGLNGLGVCIAGSLSGPTDGLCTSENVTYKTKPLEAEDWKLFLTSDSAPTWAYTTCPAEDECSNNHHNCDTNTQNCKDMPDGFRCGCKRGYVWEDEEMKCKPVCHQGCDHGRCILPDHCQCLFGYVGRNCSTKCLCNEHSNCKSVEERHVCLQCMNNTQGTHCEECKPLHVGNPVNGGRCVSCSEFCNNHTDICLDRSEYNISYRHIQQILQVYPNTKSTEFRTEIGKVLRKGPMDKDKTLCVDCQHNTEKNYCEECQLGFFQLDKSSKTEPCTQCLCNGHSDICDKDGGLNCQCHNNSETRCNSDGKDKMSECHKIQCAGCKEYFLGTPTEGHQCYRLMAVNREYCLDPNTQQECTRNPLTLMQGRTVFFAVQPKYVNVDIRVTIDVTKGGMDVFFSPKADTFIVDTDRTTGIHTVRFDPKVQIVTLQEYQSRKKRSADSDGSSSASEMYLLNELQAEDLNTFITVDSPSVVLLIRKVQFRLVITLPHNMLDLRTSRFYMIFSSTGDGLVNETTGSLYFRQDQPHIDLFVFFSVFFSCFFLFLAMCVLLWKTKQAFDARQSRQQRAREMQHMASRPFAKVLVLIDHPTSISVSPKLPLHTVKMSDRTPLLPSEPSLPPSPVVVHDSLDFIPIAIEPTDDGVAAVGTMVIRLPGGSLAPTHLCLGSALTMRSQLSHSTTKCRRRPSASTC